jgi:hypothetical protein
MASAPRRRVFSRLKTWPTCPLSTLHSRPYGRLRMTRSRCGSLFLHRMRLSLTISRRFSPAHQGLTPTVALQLLLSRNRILYLTILSLNGAIGALICAFFLALPMGYFTKHKPLITGSALGIVGELITAYRFPIQFDWFVGIITIAEYSAFVLGCVLFSWCGYRVGTRRKMTS